MPPQASVNRAMTVSGPPSASTPREYEESGGSYEDRDEQPDRAASANARRGGRGCKVVVDLSMVVTD